MRVLYLDNHLLALDKPAGMLTQPNQSSELSLQEVGKRLLKKQFKKPGAVFLEPVHRLDRPVSGIVLFARTSKALSRLQAAQRAKSFRKIYWARHEGSLPDRSGQLIHYLEHGNHLAFEHPKGKKCCLLYKQLPNGGTEIELVTGRYHQIRAQLSLVGCPILGDQKYGSKVTLDRIELYHTRMSFPHPITQEMKEIDLHFVQKQGGGHKHGLEANSESNKEPVESK